MTLTSTSIPRNEDAAPMNVPQRGNACRDPTRRRRGSDCDCRQSLLVGSKSTQPAPGRYTCIQAWVAPPPTLARSVRLRHEDVAADEACREAERTDRFHHEQCEIAATARAPPKRVFWTLHALFGSAHVGEFVLDAERHGLEQRHRVGRARCATESARPSGSHSSPG